MRTDHDHTDDREGYGYDALDPIDPRYRGRPLQERLTRSAMPRRPERAPVPRGRDGRPEGAGEVVARNGRLRLVTGHPNELRMERRMPGGWSPVSGADGRPKTFEADAEGLRRGTDALHAQARLPFEGADGDAFAVPAQISFQLESVPGGWHVLRREGGRESGVWLPVADWRGAPFLYRRKSQALREIRRASRRKSFE